MESRFTSIINYKYKFFKEQGRQHKMMTVKEISDITGISRRTLHYYDEIGLLKPTGKSDAGYRLYDNRALETLRQILFFREFGIPLKEIRAVIENPSLSRNQILQTQRKMLAAEQERLERLVSSIDKILKGEKYMDFKIFNETEVEEIFNSMVSKMGKEEKSVFTKNYGGMEGFKEHFMENASSGKTQENLKKMLEWYGSKENIMDSALNPAGREVADSLCKRLESIMDKLAERKKQGYAVDSFEIKEVVAEYGFVQKKLFGIKNENKFMLDMAGLYKDNEEAKKVYDIKYGEGMADFFAEAVRGFYREK